MTIDHEVSEPVEPMPAPEVPAEITTAAVPKRSKKRTLITAFAALAIMGIAGFTIYRNLPEGFGPSQEVPSLPPEVVQKVKAQANERAMYHTRIELQKVGDQTVVALAKPTGPLQFDDVKGGGNGMITRELVRQAYLMAARDELGLVTRDEVLEGLPIAKGEQVVSLSSGLRADGNGRVLIRQGEGDSKSVLFEHLIDKVPGEGDIIAMMLPFAEELSRTSFPENLKKLGATGTPNKFKPGSDLPPNTDERMATLGFIDHYTVVRDLHEAIRNDGESPERLGALARAYAQLGILTEHLWNPAHKVYKARALLYAQRLLHREPNSAWALWNRAFVRSLLGLHSEAVEDLAAASRKAAGDKKPEVPTWIEPAEAYANQDLGRLKAMTGPHIKLAKLLRMLSMEYPLYMDNGLLAARDVVSADVDCYRAHDLMCRMSGVAGLHVATTIGPNTFTRLLPVKLKAISGLPGDVKTALDGRRGELAYTLALEKAAAASGDIGEPGWGNLAQLIRETRYVHVMRRLLFMKTTWSVPVEDFWAEARPFVAKHRYLPYLEAYALSPPEQTRQKCVDFSNAIDINEIESHERELFMFTEQYQTVRVGHHEGGMAFGHADDVMRDLAAGLIMPDSNYQKSVAKLLNRISPNQAFAQGILVSLAWDEVKGKADEWEKRGNDSQILLSNLADRYLHLKQNDRAKALFKRCIEISPQHTFYQRLAEVYQKEGDMALWKSTLDDYIKTGQDFGLDQAKVRIEIANYLMSQDKYKEAAPYAEAAAQTWAGWAMEVAMQCYEHLGENDKAEMWAQRLSERYPGHNWAWWYCLCRRTGHENVEAAKEWTDAYLKSVEGRPDLANRYDVGYYRWLSGDPKAAEAIFIALQTQSPNSSNASIVWMLADQVGDTKKRDEMLAYLQVPGNVNFPQTGKIAQMMAQSLKDNKPLDLVAVDQVIASKGQESVAAALFCVGQFLMNRGQTEVGRKYIQKASESQGMDGWWYEIAWRIVRSPVKRKNP